MIFELINPSDKCTFEAPNLTPLNNPCKGL